MGKIIAVDIGNSNIVVGIWNGPSLEFTGRLQTRRDYSEKELREDLAELINEDVCDKGKAYEGAILSSVVPEITDVTMNVLENIIGKRPLLMGPFLCTGIDLSEYAEGAIGMDRIVDVSAAVAMYGAPVMVCDLGTCTTITVAVKSSSNDKPKENGKIIGGMICAGIQLSLDAQAERASQLPELQAGEAISLLGKDTASNMMSGAVAGSGLMISELADRLMDGYHDFSMGKELCPGCQASGLSEDMSELKVVITGGNARFVIPWIKCKANAYYEQNLLLRGLCEIYKMNTDRS